MTALAMLLVGCRVGDEACESPPCDSEDTDTAGPGDTGSAADPPDWTVCGDGTGDFEEVQDAVDAATDGDVIGVCEGTFEWVSIERRDIELRGAGSALTILDGGAANTALTIADSAVTVRGLGLTSGAPQYSGLDGTDSDLILRDIRISGADPGGYVVWLFGGTADVDELLIEGNTLETAWYSDLTSLVARHVVIRDNETHGGSTQTGRGIGLSGTDFEFSNSQIVDNDFGEGPTIDGRAAEGVGWIWNNTIADNLGGGGSRIYVGQNTIFENNIVSNGDDPGASHTGVTATPGSTVQYNLIDGYRTATSGDLGEGNIEGDPRFEGDDYSLSEFSPAIDAGNPIEAYNDEDGTRNDMGAFGGPSGGWTTP